MEKEDETYMKLALEEAQKAKTKEEVPVGAVLVKSDKVLARAHNLCETHNDSTAHAEMLVIQNAARKIRNWRLTGTTLYITKEPCPMCAGAIIQARIEKVVYGAIDEKAGAAGTLFNILQDRRLNHQVEIVSGVMANSCKELLQDFFKIRRQRF